MNPQNISTSFVIATDYMRAMRGGAQSHMLTANDGHAYVVKFANNPQSLRVLANEWLGCSIVADQVHKPRNHKIGGASRAAHPPEKGTNGTKGKFSFVTFVPSAGAKP